MPDAFTNHGLWERSAPPGPDLPVLTGAARTEVAIIGAGYTGLSAALHLAEGGAAVTVLEAAQPGFGASGRNVGLVNATALALPGEALRGAAQGGRLADFLGDAPQQVYGLIARLGIDCGAVHHGTLHLAAGPESLAAIARLAAHWQRRGAPVDLLNAQDTRLRLGGGAYDGALFDARAGTVQPLALARGMARAAVAAGARIHRDSAVAAVTREGTDWVLRTARGVLRAKWLLPAAEAFTARAFPEVLTEQVMVPFVCVATAPLPAAIRAAILPGGEGCRDIGPAAHAFRLDAAGRMVWGVTGRSGPVDRDGAERAMRHGFPRIADAGIESFWRGRIAMTADALPRLHLLGPQALTICGHGGRGIAAGTVCGMVLARHVLGAGDARHPLSVPSADGVADAPGLEPRPSRG